MKLAGEIEEVITSLNTAVEVVFSNKALSEREFEEWYKFRYGLQLI